MRGLIAVLAAAWLHMTNALMVVGALMSLADVVVSLVGPSWGPLAASATFGQV